MLAEQAEDGHMFSRLHDRRRLAGVLQVAEQSNPTGRPRSYLRREIDHLLDGEAGLLASYDQPTNRAE